MNNTEWKEVTLSELGVLQRGRSRHRPRYAFHLYGGKYPFIQTGDVKASGRKISSFTQTYSEAGLAQSKLWPKGTLCITIAANIAEVGILDFDACFPDSVLGFIPNNELADVRFIYYSLVEFKKELQALGEGSVQDNINLGTFENFRIPIPPLSEQQRIAEVLSSLDDKIDLLHRQNQTLEQLAETLFRQWFVEEAEENETVLLQDMIVFYNGKERPQEEGLIPVYGGNGILGYTNKYNYDKETIIIGRVGAYCGSVYFESDPVWISDNALAAKSKNHPLSNYYFYYLLKGLDLNSLAEGSSHPLITQTLLKSIEVQHASEEKVLKFGQFASDWHKKIKANKAHILKLEQTRDTLLPKLMSGAVRVNN